jgi:hypothetical protein
MLDLHIFFLSDQGILSPIVRDTGRLVATHEVVKPRTTRTPALEEAVF